MKHGLVQNDVFPRRATSTSQTPPPLGMSEDADNPEPSHPPPHNDLPEGITITTTSGVAVLRLAFDGDDERVQLDKEDEKRKKQMVDPKPVLTTLHHPNTHTPVQIIGTAHVSSLAARQTRDLILKEKPDVVVIELDPQRLTSMLRDAQLKLPARHLAETNVKTHLDALNVLWQGRFVHVVGGLTYAAVGAVLGSQPGAEFLAAIDAAQEVNAKIILGDLNAKTTTARLFARTTWRKALRHANEKVRRQEQDTSRANISIKTSASVSSGRPTKKGTIEKERPTLVWPDGGERPAPVATPNEIKELMTDAGCDAFSTERGAWHLAMHQDPDPADLLAVRKCVEKVVELLRSEAYLEKHGRFSEDADDDVDDDGDAPSTSPSTSSYSSGWAMDRTLRVDRDLVLAHSLQRGAVGAKKVVGVVGAAHVRGIKKEWPQVSSQSSKQKFQKTLHKTPEECTLVGAQKRFGPNNFSWWDQPGYFETGVAGVGALGLMGLSRYGGKSGGSNRNLTTEITKSTEITQAANLAKSFSSRVNRAAWFGVVVTAGACVTGCAVATHAMVELGRFATKLEQTGLAAEAAGVVSPKKNELRSPKWNAPDAFGNTTRNIFVDAVNVVMPYNEKEEKEW